MDAAGDSMASPQDPDYLLLGQLAHGFMASQVLFAACELGVFDLLAEAGPLDAIGVAARLDTSPQATETLLDTCVSLRLLTRDATVSPAAYGSTRLSRTFLARGSPLSQTHLLSYTATTVYRTWAHLASAVREGRNQHLRAFGASSRDLFSAIYRSEEERLLFLRALQQTWGVHGPPTLTAFDLSPFARICDLGGGLGGLARQCAALYPNSRVTVLDLPEVVAVARTHCPLPQDARVNFLEGDFLRDPLPVADLFILARILHDWTDDRCRHLLARVRAACTPGGGVLVVESLLDADGRGPLATQLLSVNMLLQTEGRERSAGEYHALLAAAGFSHLQVRSGLGLYAALLATQ
ncbi:acetylserotonin O-methyltransferase [Erinaceus europaeus]|uniref:Acetylserotonin O-methyltransferase n=1 Tax=Erinaceus europaeus TaxID=9365 RepID=A0ABM3WS57_ERIEU|nr:acetylserotonin O-methyltransferase [Erinaceus europaeus]